MVIRIRLIASFLTILVAALGATSCSHQGATAAGGPTNTRGSTSVRTVMPSPPIECDGIKDLSRAQELVDSGQAVALISATITGEAGHEEDATRLVPIDSYFLLAGHTRFGSVKQVEESAADDKTNSLEPGSYLLLLGVTGQESTYFLSDGLRGSFIVEGNNAYEQCPNYADPDHSIIIRTGITDIQELAKLFETALPDESGR